MKKVFLFFASSSYVSSVCRSFLVFSFRSRHLIFPPIGCECARLVTLNCVWNTRERLNLRIIFPPSSFSATRSLSSFLLFHLTRVKGFITLLRLLMVSNFLCSRVSARFRAEEGKTNFHFNSSPPQHQTFPKHWTLLMPTCADHHDGEAHQRCSPLSAFDNSPKA